MPAIKILRVIIDTNLWVCFIISKKLHLLDNLLINGNLCLLFSSVLLDEIAETIKKPRLQKYFQQDSFNEMFSVFEPFMELIDVQSDVTICRDQKDNFLLALAKDGKADFILTGDQDLLVIERFGKTKIVTFSSFLHNIITNK